MIAESSIDWRTAFTRAALRGNNEAIGVRFAFTMEWIERQLVSSVFSRVPFENLAGFACAGEAERGEQDEKNDRAKHNQSGCRITSHCCRLLTARLSAAGGALRRGCNAINASFLHFAEHVNREWG